MECPACHFKNPEDISYCGKCGKQLAELKGLSK